MSIQTPRRYFFHIEDHQPIWDEQGQTCADDAQAYSVAIGKGAELLKAILERGTSPHEDWRIEVLDQTGRLVAKLRFNADLQ